jgi:hypothetical protein
MVTVDADRSFSVFCKQQTPWRHHMIPGYLSREVNARTVLPVSDYARRGLTRFEIIVYGTLIRPRSRRRGTEEAGRLGLTEQHMNYLRARADNGMRPLSGLRLAKLRQRSAPAVHRVKPRSDHPADRQSGGNRAIFETLDRAGGFPTWLPPAPRPAAARGPG